MNGMKQNGNQHVLDGMTRSVERLMQIHAPTAVKSIFFILKNMSNEGI